MISKPNEPKEDMYVKASLRFCIIITIKLKLQYNKNFKCYKKCECYKKINNFFKMLQKSECYKKSIKKLWMLQKKEKFKCYKKI